MDEPRRILVVGNGGRECALSCALLLSPRVEALYISPANWGVVDPYADRGGSRVQALDIKVGDHAALAQAARDYAIDLAVVGPEQPLVDGVADELRAAGIPVMGPGREAARLEGSKLFAKQFMQRHGIPTGGFESFTDYGSLKSHLEQLDGPCVLKADGLAAGKGVIVCSGREEALAGAKRIMDDREFGSAGDLALVEERLYGDEISFTCLVSGTEARLLLASTDYKPLLDGNEGPNTGGMGNICPTPFATPEVIAEFEEKILKPFSAGLKADGLDYRGFLFIGTMLNEQGLKVLEFNVRIGDPEAQVVLPMVEADWPRLLAGIAAGELDTAGITIRPGACVAVCVATANYPYGKSEPAVIEGLDRVHNRGLLTPAPDSPPGAPPPVSIYFAGVSAEAANEAAAGDDNTGAEQPYGNYYSNLGQRRYLATGGRVLAVSAYGADLSDARRLAYEVLGNLRFDGMKYRSDIGKLR